MTWSPWRKDPTGIGKNRSGGQERRYEVLRSMASAISGIRNHQIYMDVVANNIANINTHGFKASRVNFKEAIAQTGKSGSEPTGATGGVNPVQVGLGLTLGGVDSIMQQGSLISTGKNTDLAIQGEGFFILGSYDDSDGDGVADAYLPSYYTRDGAFGLDKDGYLVERVSGYYVMDSTAATPSRIQIDPAWNWATFSIGPDGMITGVRGDGSTDPDNHPQIGLAKFSNPEGLIKAGGNLYQAGPNSGVAAFAAPGVDARGMLVPGALEASNVDLAEQFSRMIMAGRGFQASARVITASDEMLQDLVNIKR